jgi:hypothetical protein
MKQSMTLNELAAELQRQSAAKVDYIADTRRMHFTTTEPEEHVDGTRPGGVSTIDLVGDGADPDASDLIVLPHAHHQIADVLGVPWRYYERLRTTNGLRGLLDRNVNQLFHHRAERQLLRTLDGKARAFLSDRYRRLDNDDLAETLIPILGAIPDVRFESCHVDEERMYIKAYTPRVVGEVKVGEEVCAGVFITNSEVGAGSFRVEPFVYTLACTNGMVVSKSLADSIRRIHVGRRLQADDGGRVFRDETLAADDRAFFLAAGDVVRAAVDEVRFRDLVAAMKAAAESTPVQNVPAAVERLAKTESLGEGEASSILTHLAAGGDLSKWGVLSAVTRHAEDVESYQRATELEELGGKILAYSDREWAQIATAA